MALITPNDHTDLAAVMKDLGSHQEEVGRLIVSKLGRREQNWIKNRQLNTESTRSVSQHGRGLQLQFLWATPMSRTP
jgi:hypothetical protein